MKKSEKKPSLRRILQNNFYSISFIWKFSKGYLIVSLINTLICGLFLPITLMMTSRMFDLLEKRCTFEEVFTIILLLIVSTVFYSLWGVLYNNVISPKYIQHIHLRVHTGFFEKVRRMELSQYDDPDYYNEFVLTMENADTYATAALSNLNSILSNLLTIGTTLGLVVYVDLVAMVVMLISAVLSMISDAKLKKLEFEFHVESTPFNRKKGYIDRVHRLADYAKELRLTDFGEKLSKDYSENTEEYIKLIKRHGKKTIGWRVFNMINGRGVYLAVIAWTIYKMAVIGSVTLGGFSIIITSCNSFKNSLVNFARKFNELSKQSMYIDKVRDFMEYEPKERIGTLSAPKFESIELKDVSFGYNSDDIVLHNVSMSLRRGEKIAIVGYNGAGKSTLIKLLMHLYEPTEGFILYNGKDFREFEIDSYRSHIGAVFQDYKIFAASIGENVLGDECLNEDFEAVEHALHLASFDNKLSSLPDGINTILTREFDDKGTNLSGGEAQKIAIARVFARPFDVVIMDEPSSSLDPIAEFALNKSITAYSEDKTVIFISHRLSTTRHVDRIYMLENGSIIEVGSHDELMKLGGKYAEMFRVQAEKYKYIEV